MGYKDLWISFLSFLFLAMIKKIKIAETKNQIEVQRNKNNKILEDTLIADNINCRIPNSVGIPTKKP